MASEIPCPAGRTRRGGGAGARERAIARLGEVNCDQLVAIRPRWVWRSPAGAGRLAGRRRSGQARGSRRPDGAHLVPRRDDAALAPALPGIDLVITGHSPGPVPRWARRNVLCIDTGVDYADCGHLTVADVQEPELALHRFARG